MFTLFLLVIFATASKYLVINNTLSNDVYELGVCYINIFSYLTFEEKDGQLGVSHSLDCKDMLTCFYPLDHGMSFENKLPPYAAVGYNYIHEKKCEIEEKGAKPRAMLYKQGCIKEGTSSSVKFEIVDDTFYRYNYLTVADCNGFPSSIDKRELNKCYIEDIGTSIIYSNSAATFFVVFALALAFLL